MDRLLTSFQRLAMRCVWVAASIPIIFGIAFIHLFLTGAGQYTQRLNALYIGIGLLVGGALVGYFGIKILNWIIKIVNRHQN